MDKGGRCVRATTERERDKDKEREGEMDGKRGGVIEGTEKWRKIIEIVRESKRIYAEKKEIRQREVEK